MSEGIVTSVPSALQAPVEHKPLPVITNTGFMIPDEVFSFFDISDPRQTTNTNTKERLHNVIHYFWENIGGGELGDVLEAMQKIQTSFGAPRLGSNRLDQMFNYVTIQRQINQLEKRKKALSNG